MRETPVTAVDPPPPVARDLKPFRRMVASQAMFLGLVLLIVGQLVRWQIIERSTLLQDGNWGSPDVQQIPSQRGLILDRNHNLLALNNYDYTIEAAPRMIAAGDKESVANKLAAVLDRPVEEMLDKVQGNAPYVQIARHVPRDAGKAVIALHEQGIFCLPLAVRIYPEGTLAAHALGFVAGDAEEGTKGYYGVEGFYDRTLKGQTGLRDERWDPWLPVSFADRRVQQWTIPQDGRTLVLTIDRTIQYLIEQELHAAVKRYGAESGSIVVMDPKTGALLAIASYPTYDPNRFDETSPDLLVDPVVGIHYEPGSTFKIITMAAALDTGLVQPTDIFVDVGEIEVGGRILKNWDKRAYGTVTMTEILVRSLNTGIAHVSTVLGPERFYQYVSRFGFGHKTGIDLEGEVPGATRQPGDPEWHESDLGTNSFGQGLAVTPLQMVVAAGAIANRGVVMRPYVVEELVEEDRSIRAKQVSAGQVIGEDTAQLLTEMMVKVVDQGTPLAQVEGYRIAGKTGTAQTPVVGGYDPNLTIASFVGFAPADDPQFVVLVKLDKPTASPWGTETAAPAFANVARILFTQLEIPPDEVRMAMN
jgi:cell division protein FtsI (penicillin-binding protein 3)